MKQLFLSLFAYNTTDQVFFLTPRIGSVCQGFSGHSCLGYLRFNSFFTSFIRLSKLASGFSCPFVTGIKNKAKMISI